MLTGCPQKRNLEEQRICKVTPGLAKGTSAHPQLHLSSFALPSPHLGCPTTASPADEGRGEQLMLATDCPWKTLLPTTVGFPPPTRGACEETNPRCYQICSLSDTFLRRPLLQQQWRTIFHMPRVSVSLEKAHPPPAWWAVTPSEASCGFCSQVCWHSWVWAGITALFKDS